MQVANVGALALYYKTTYAAVRAACPECFVAISPLLWQQDGGAWQTFMAASPYFRVLQDLHRHMTRDSSTIAINVLQLCGDE